MDLVQKIIIKATDKASAAMQRVRANSTGLAGALDKTNKELKKLEGAEKKLAAYPGLKQKLSETKQAFRDNCRDTGCATAFSNRRAVSASTPPPCAKAGSIPAIWPTGSSC